MEILFEVLGEALAELIELFFDWGTGSKAPKWLRCVLNTILTFLTSAAVVLPIISGILLIAEVGC